MKNVLVLGASGLLGAYVSQALMEQEDLVVCLQSRNRQESFRVFNPVNQEELFGDLSDIKPDVIVNLIAMTNVDECEFNVNEAYRVNTLLPENLSRWISNYSPKTHLIHISTDHVYTQQGYQYEKEVNPSNVYSLSKYAGELALKQVKNITILRTNFFGPSFNLHRKSFSDWIYESLRDHMRIKLANDIFFNPVSLIFLASSISRLISSPLYGIYNIGSRAGMSKYDFGVQFSKALGFGQHLIDCCNACDLTFKVTRPSDMRMNVEFIESSWGPMPTLDNLITGVAKEYEPLPK